MIGRSVCPIQIVYQLKCANLELMLIQLFVWRIFQHEHVTYVTCKYYTLLFTCLV